MLCVRSIVRPAAVLGAACLAGILALPAQALDLQVGTYARSGIGEEFASGFDNFTLAGNTVAIPDSASAVVSLATLSFEVGPNCYSCTLTPSFDAVVDVAIQGVTQQLDLPVAWTSSGPNDFLSFARPAPVVFDLASLGLVTLTFDAPATLWAGGGIVSESLTATVATTPVPEPDTLSLVLSGLALGGVVARRRRA